MTTAVLGGNVWLFGSGSSAGGKGLKDVMFCAKTIIIITPNQLQYSDWESKDGLDEISVKVHHQSLPKVIEHYNTVNRLGRALCSTFYVFKTACKHKIVQLVINSSR